MKRRTVIISLIVGAMLFLILPIAIFYLGVDLKVEAFLSSWIVSAIIAWFAVVLNHLSKEKGKLRIIILIIAILLSIVVLGTLKVMSLVISTP